jgi:hypothetical protein
MFVSSVHYSDYLENGLCIQDQFTISTSPYRLLDYVKSIGA